MSAYVTDTHALIWHLTADAQLSPACRGSFEAADRGEQHDLNFLFGSWVEDPEVDQALAEQRNIKPDLWR